MAKPASIVMFLSDYIFITLLTLLMTFCAKTETLEISVFKGGILFMPLTTLMFTKLMLYL